LAQIHRVPEDAAARGPRIAREYARSHQLRLYGYEEDVRVVGLVGIESSEEGRAIVRDLAVTADARMRGIGRSLIQHVRELGFASLEGNTLAPAVAFYGRCGFTVREDGKMPDGQMRYRFSWTREWAADN
jgi:N-acetylglutamate synthase-like GNAT family acetyltransferase